MKYIPDAIKEVSSILLAIPLFIVIVGCLWIKKIVGRKE